MEEVDNSPDCFEVEETLYQLEPLHPTCFDDDDTCTVIEMGHNKDKEDTINPTIVCRKCYKTGHVALQCKCKDDEKNKVGMKQYLRHEGLEHHLTQQERRWQSICKKKGWDVEIMRGCKGYEWSRKRPT